MFDKKTISRGNKMGSSTSSSSLLLSISSIVILTTLCHINHASSVIMPPRLQSAKPEPPVDSEHLVVLARDEEQLLQNEADVPYLLSINEGDSIDIKVKTANIITVNLNRAPPEDVRVIVSVKSRPELITLDKPINSIEGNNTVEVIYLRNTFGDKHVLFHSNDAAGHAEIVCKVAKSNSTITIDDSTSFISVNVGKNSTIELIIHLVGWIYFIAWSMSFYFQVILNYRRKSVVGLNFDFLALNLLGFTCYFIFNYSLMFSREAQDNYYQRHEYSRIPVEYNDLFFAAHAVLLTIITIAQCFIYERNQQRVSIAAALFLFLAVSGSIVCCIIHFASPTTLILLDVLLYFSYVKLIITIIKYTPQAYMNYSRKATTGWSIHNILLDFTGGFFSLLQMFLIAYNYDDWLSIFGNFTKFGLGLVSITFDIVFLVQHYILYKEVGQLDVSTDSVPSPVINQSVITASFRQPSDDGISNAAMDGTNTENLPEVHATTGNDGRSN